MGKANISLRRLDADDAGLEELAEELNNPEQWGDYDVKFSSRPLKKFLQDDRHIYLLAYIDGHLAGAAHAYVMQHPAGPVYLYIDEVDTAKQYRRQGTATAMMREIIRLARHYGAKEVWLGTEDDNIPAKALYENLSPSEVEHGPLYTYKIADNKQEWYG